MTALVNLFETLPTDLAQGFSAVFAFLAALPGRGFDHPAATGGALAVLAVLALGGWYALRVRNYRQTGIAVLYQGQHRHH